jgi:hypothetical protein
MQENERVEPIRQCQFTTKKRRFLANLLYLSFELYVRVLLFELDQNHFQRIVAQVFGQMLFGGH